MLLERAVAALESIALSLTLLTQDDAPTQDAAPATVAEPAKPRGRPRKDAAPTTVAEPEPAPVAAKPAPVAAPAAPAPSYEPLRAAVLALANTSSEGKAAAINVLSRFGVKKAAEIPTSQWGEAQEAFEAELAILTGNDDAFA